MGSFASCLSHGKQQDDQALKRRPVKKEEIERPVTKRVSSVSAMQPDAVIVDGGDEKGDSIDFKCQESKSLKVVQETSVAEEAEEDRTGPLTKKRTERDESKVAPRIDDVHVTSLVSEAGESEASIKQRISAVEMLRGGDDGTPSKEASLDVRTSFEVEEQGEVRKKIQKYNELDKMATVDDELQVKSGKKRKFVVKKSLGFLTRAAVFEKGPTKNISEEVVPMSEVSHVGKVALMQDAVRGSKFRDSGRMSPTHVAEYAAVHV